MLHHREWHVHNLIKGFAFQVNSKAWHTCQDSMSQVIDTHCYWLRVVSALPRSCTACVHAHVSSGSPVSCLCHYQKHQRLIFPHEWPHLPRRTSSIRVRTFDNSMTLFPFCLNLCDCTHKGSFNDRFSMRRAKFEARFVKKFARVCFLPDLWTFVVEEKWVANTTQLEFVDQSNFRQTGVT